MSKGRRPLAAAHAGRGWTHGGGADAAVRGATGAVLGQPAPPWWPGCWPWAGCWPGVALAAQVRVANAASNAFALTREELLRDWREIRSSCDRASLPLTPQALPSAGANCANAWLPSASACARAARSGSKNANWPASKPR